MTTRKPEEIREDIEVTRSRLSDDVDELADNVRPSTMVRITVNRVRDRLSGMGPRVTDIRERTMGTVQGTVHGVRETGGSVAGTVGDAATAVPDRVREVPGRVRDETRGNPLAAGLVDFGVGWLAGSLIRAGEAERQASEWVKEQAAPVAHQTTDIAKDTAAHLREPAQQAVQSVRETASEATGTVRSEARSEAGSTMDETRRVAAR
ncbi:MAG: DUF3618 domain-containing protein [Actinomycetales bacterium]|nr:DUF3618 domain-containing protein [Actinomycetales bacterium]